MEKRLRVVIVCGAIHADIDHLRQLRETVDLTVYAADGGPSIDILRQKVPVRAFQSTLRSSRGHLFYYYRGLSRALTTDRPDIVHVISEPWGILCVQAARWVRRNPRAKLVAHGCDTIWHHGSGAEKSIRRAVLRYTVPTLHAYTAENASALVLADQAGLRESAPRARIHTNPRSALQWRTATSEERQYARRRLGLRDGDIAVGFIGRLVTAKGLPYFLQAAKSVAESHPQHFFFVAGSGPLADDVARAANDRLTFLRALPYPDGVRHLLHALDVVACPSISTPAWEDQGPRILLEAMMSGVVPIGTQSGGIPEMIGEFGTLCRQGDPQALAGAIIEAGALSVLPAYRSKLARWATAQYSSHANCRQLLDLWRDICPEQEDKTLSVGRPNWEA